MVSHSLMQYFLHLVLPGATSDAKVLLWEENKRKEKVSFLFNKYKSWRILSLSIVYIVWLRMNSVN